MKTKIITLVAAIILVGTCLAKADLVFSSGHNTYDDSYGYNFEVWVENDAILDVLGGEIGKLETINFATANLYSSDIDWLWTRDSSVVNIYGDNINWLAAYDDSSINLYAYDVTYHPTGGGDYGNNEWIEGIYYSDASSFSFWLYNDEAYSHINIVPEPSSLILLGLGSLLWRKGLHKSGNFGIIESR